MDRPHDMTTLSQVIGKLHSKGYDNELKMHGSGQMKNPTSGKIYNPADLILIKTYRFEGDSDPADSSALFLFEDKDGEKSYVMDIYGAASDHEEEGFDEFLKQVPEEERDYESIYGKD